VNINIRYKRNTHQDELHNDLTSKLIHLSTGFGGGKTYGLCMKALQLSVINKHTDGGLVCPDYADFQKDVLPTFEDIFEANRIQYSYHGQKHYFSFPWTKRKLWVVTAKKKLRGPNWGYALINEVTLIPLVRYREVLGRVRDRRAVIPQIVSVGTPEGIGSEYYGFFIESPPPNMNLKVIYGDTRDNAQNLSDDYIRTLESSYDKTMLDAYLKGLWVNMVGHQFYYAYDPDKNEDKNIQHRADLPVLVGLDFNVDYMTATLWHQIDGQLWGFGEIVLESNADTAKMGQALISRGYTPDRTTIYPDPAGAARSTKGRPDHVILKDLGFEIIARAAAPRFRERQLNMNNLLDKGTIRYNPDAMPHLRRDLQAVEQDPVTLEKVKKNAKLTHASDGLDYLCDIVFPFSGRRVNSEVITYR
jgi:hypothetical protein